ncbi:MAG TPA: KTSC domain-containing protein [Zeimonas sp.]|jgi:AAA+ superfamily predicted ATPase|nr:KTSC domain-containing protein [Zeimonas sp.]
MALERRTLRGGRLKAAGYDAREQRLEIDFADGERRVFKAVPPEVWRRLVAAPNPAVFYADRIEEEYAFERGRAGPSSDARTKLDRLFGGGGKEADEGVGGGDGDGD